MLAPGVPHRPLPTRWFGIGWVEGKPETFNFLGFTHVCGKTRSAKSLLMRRSMRTRLRAKLEAVKAERMLRRPLPITEPGMWVSAVVRGNDQYHAIPMNIVAIQAFRAQVTRHWLKALDVEASGTGCPGPGRNAWSRDGFPPRASCSPGPKSDLTPDPEARAQCGNAARWDLCGGRPDPTCSEPSLPRSRSLQAPVPTLPWKARPSSMPWRVS